LTLKGTWKCELLMKSRIFVLRYTYALLSKITGLWLNLCSLIFRFRCVSDAEHKWRASPGTYVFEPQGETHTLLVDKEEMVTMFHVTGSLLYVNEKDDIIGFDDVFSKLEKAKKWYSECGLGEGYVQQFVR